MRKQLYVVFILIFGLAVRCNKDSTPKSTIQNTNNKTRIAVASETKSTDIKGYDNLILGAEQCTLDNSFKSSSPKESKNCYFWKQENIALDGKPIMPVDIIIRGKSSEIGSILLSFDSLSFYLPNLEKITPSRSWDSLAEMSDYVYTLRNAIMDKYDDSLVIWDDFKRKKKLYNFDPNNTGNGRIGVLYLRDSNGDELVMAWDFYKFTSENHTIWVDYTLSIEYVTLEYAGMDPDRVAGKWGAVEQKATKEQVNKF